MMAMEFCGREYNFPTHFGEVADTCGDLNIACPSCLLAHIAKLEAHIAQLEAQRGGAVVVPELTESDIDAIWRDVEDINDASRAMAAWAYRLAVSRIQPIPANQVLADGMVGVDRERLAALEAISDKIEALALGPDGRAWTPLHYREFARGELRRAQQTKGE